MSSLNLILCAVAAAALDICILVLLYSAYHERSTSNKRWNRITSFMELADNVNVYPLGCDEILIGRHASADIRLPDMSVSRYHAILSVSNGIWTITDMGSTSGILINGTPVRQAQLIPNDIISLGNRRLIFRQRRDINVR
ncbi:MAG: FHA domain-containing protein [Ruminococcus sp.]|nr:FHA domain-containing protein [Ruminococcus sp.]